MADVQKPCETCGVKIIDHRFSELIFCLYGGSPKKDGTPFGRADAVGVVQSVRERLLR